MGHTCNEQVFTPVFYLEGGNAYIRYSQSLVFKGIHYTFLHTENLEESSHKLKHILNQDISNNSDISDFRMIYMNILYNFQIYVTANFWQIPLKSDQ